MNYGLTGVKKSDETISSFIKCKMKLCDALLWASYFVSEYPMPV